MFKVYNITNPEKRLMVSPPFSLHTFEQAREWLESRVEALGVDVETLHFETDSENPGCADMAVLWNGEVLLFSIERQPTHTCPSCGIVENVKTDICENCGI